MHASPISLGVGPLLLLVHLVHPMCLSTTTTWLPPLTTLLVLPQHTPVGPANLVAPRRPPVYHRAPANISLSELPSQFSALLASLHVPQVTPARSLVEPSPGLQCPSLILRRDSHALP